MNTHTITINSPFIHSLQHNIQPDNKSLIHAMPRPTLRSLAIRVFRLRTVSESDRRAQPISRRSTGESSSRAFYHSRAGHVGRTQGYSPMSRRERDAAGWSAVIRCLAASMLCRMLALGRPPGDGDADHGRGRCHRHELELATDVRGWYLAACPGERRAETAGPCC